MPFVYSNHKNAPRGLGKLLDVGQTDGTCTIEYFLGPLEDTKLVTVPLSTVTQNDPEKHTRAYIKDKDEKWFVGRIIDGVGTKIEIKFPELGRKVLKVADVHIRCEQSIEDPTPYLAAWINETPLFTNARSAFREHLIEQRRASLGMSAILSSVIDLETHQLKVVRKVLQDPIQRYFLADEVGLGKTIEAGIIIRQYLLDNGPQAKTVVVIIPENLINQWRNELDIKFSLGSSSKIVLVGMNQINRLEELLKEPGMVVIDEAHHLSENRVLYDIILRKTRSISHLLLLSATPILRNEAGFLKLLQLLDPDIYSKVELPAFKERMSQRQSISEISAGLVPENSLIITDFIRRLDSYSLDNETLQVLTENLKKIVRTYPSQDDVEFCRAINSVRDHLSEVYKLDRRILTNRRSGNSVSHLTPKRSGAKIVSFNSHAFQLLDQEFHVWTNETLRICNQFPKDQQIEISKKLFELQSAIACLDQDKVEEIISLCPAGLPSLEQISNYANDAINDFNRDDALHEVIEKLFLKSEKAVLFCSSKNIAQRLFDDLEELRPGGCARRDSNEIPHEESTILFEEDIELVRFKSDPTCRILICDQRDEEGLNLQGICKTIIHYDSVMSPNRVEQRIGRLDRYGSGDQISSVVLSCLDNPLEEAWAQLLDSGLQVYSQSIATLQYLIDEKMREIQTKFLFEGTDIIYEISELMSGERGETAQEIRKIKQQEQLEAMSEEDDTWIEKLHQVDDEWLSFKESSDKWMGHCLHIKTQPIDVSRLDVPLPEAKPFRFQMHVGGQGNVLIPLKQINKYLTSGLDRNAVGFANNNLLSNIYTFRRQTALTAPSAKRSVRLFKLGDEFNSGVERLTSMDERGRVFAHWRVHQRFTPKDTFEKFLTFQFLVEGDTLEMESFLNSNLGPDRGFSKAALRRKIDAFFKPLWTRIWVDDEYKEVTDNAIVSILDERFIPRTQRNTNSTDVHLNSLRILPIQRSGLLNDWSEFVFTAKKAALELLQDSDVLKNAISNSTKAAKISINKNNSAMRVRQSRTNPQEKNLMEFEQELSKCLELGILKPKIHLESVGAIFLSNQKYLQAFPKVVQT